MASTAAQSERFAPLPSSYLSAPAAAEEAVLERWRAERTFEAVQAARAGAPPFVFWEGPPTANGRPGIHHVFSRTLKDAVCRFHTMLGRYVERKAGWDTHGLPVELEVEKALSISGKQQIEAYGVQAFNDKCRESVWKYRSDWERLSARIGYWLDYERPYVTYAGEYVDSLWYLLAQLHRQGLVYRGKRVLPYCGRCGTGLSSHELGQPGVYRDRPDPSVTVRFPLLGERQGEALLAWTTTPWTLPSNVALAVHPERNYVRARVPLGSAKASDQREIVWLAAERAAAVLGTQAELLEQRSGRELEGWRYRPPFGAEETDRFPRVDPGAWKPSLERVHTVLLADYVTVDEGTGVVHQAPCYGADDWDTARRHSLPVLQAVGPAGRFVSAVAGVAEGTFFKEADESLMDDLKRRGRLFQRKSENHSYPHCWRCDTPLYYFATPAWYVRTTAYRERMVEENRRIRWAPPEIGKKRFGEWLENNVDWNLSRDRYWGTPLPYWVCGSCEHEEALESAAALAERAGGLPEGFDHHKPSVDQVTFACPRCRGSMRRTSAVADCWFDSGAMPYAQHGWPHRPGSEAALRRQFPADFICEGLDQTRGWFYTLHAIGSFAAGVPEWKLGPAPAYRACLVNGLVLDKDGVKMSKRLGNVVDPWQVLAEHGADAVRWYLVSSAAPWLPKRFDPEGLAEARRKLFGTLANSYQFFREYARLDGFDPLSSALPPRECWPEMDRWITSRAQTLLARVRELGAALDLSGAAREIERFVIDDLSNWYIRRNRRRFWKGETGPDKLAAFAALYGALSVSALCLAPLAPFLSELIWQRLSARPGSVHGELLPEPRRECMEPQLEEAMEWVQRVVVMGRALREAAGLRVRQPLRALHVRSADPRALERLAMPFAAREVLEELNVKAFGSLAADDGQLVRLCAKANFRVLGKLLGPRMKAAAAQIETLGAEVLARLRAGGRHSLEIDGESIELDQSMLDIRVESRAEFPVETDGELVVWLDTQLDGDLVAEGLAREVVNRVNGLRKDLGLAVEERIHLRLSAAGPAADPDLARSLERHGKLISSETLAAQLDLVPSAEIHAWAQALGRATFDLGEGRLLDCALARVDGR